MNDEDHKKRKYILLAIIALLIAFLAFFLAQIAEDQATANNQSKLNVPPSPCTNFTFLQTFNGTSTICNTIPLQGTLTYFFDNETSLNTVNASKRMNQTPNATETVKLYPNVPNNQSIQNWTTKQGFPALSFIPAGEFLVHIHASKGASGQAHIYFNIWEVNNTGVWIRQIGTTEHGLLTTSEAEYELVYVAPNTIFLNSSLSRIMVQTEIHILSGSPDVTLYFGGTADSKLQFPSVTVDATNFVPYTGATSNVDLGSHDLNVNNITTSNKNFVIVGSDGNSTISVPDSTSGHSIVIKQVGHSPGNSNGTVVVDGLVTLTSDDENVKMNGTYSLLTDEHIFKINNTAIVAINKSGERVTGRIVSDNGSINNEGNLLCGITPTFAGWSINPGTSANMCNELTNALTTSGTLAGGALGTVIYDTGSSKRIVINLLVATSSGTYTYFYIALSDDGTNYYISTISAGAQSIQGGISTIGKGRYIKFAVLANTAPTVVTFNARAYNI